MNISKQIKIKEKVGEELTVFVNIEDGKASHMFINGAVSKYVTVPIEDVDNLIKALTTVREAALKEGYLRDMNA